MRQGILCALTVLLAAMGGGCQMLFPQVNTRAEAWEGDDLSLGSAAGEGARAMRVPAAAGATEGGEPAADAAAQPAPDRKILYTAQLALVVNNVRTAIEQSSRVARTLGGYVEHMGNARVILRVPGPRFHQALLELEALGTVTDRRVDARDVTESYQDLELRARNARTALAKLEDLLAKAKTVEEALAVEREMTRVREEIERLETQLRSLGSRVDYATITVTLTPVPHASRAHRAALPFGWLDSLGLDTLMTFNPCH